MAATTSRNGTCQVSQPARMGTQLERAFSSAGTSRGRLTCAARHSRNFRGGGRIKRHRHETYRRRAYPASPCQGRTQRHRQVQCDDRPHADPEGARRPIVGTCAGKSARERHPDTGLGQQRGGQRRCERPDHCGGRGVSTDRQWGSVWSPTVHGAASAAALATPKSRRDTEPSAGDNSGDREQ